MDWRDLRDRIDTRLDQALVLAQAVVPGIEMKKGGRNKQRWTPDSEVTALRGYAKTASTNRLGASDTTLERTVGAVFVQIMVPPETGDDAIVDIANAIKPAFETAADGLEFEEAPELTAGRLDGAHWMAVASFRFYADAIVTT